ncbi:hypothetical protein FRB91_008555 [Serendipita sp. 411]|nr:hypothetical protein FRB91_008555 [Serendipita sp. 411]
MEDNILFSSSSSLMDRLQIALHDLHLMRYISVLTFEKERTWIWSNKMTLTKALFLINRYSAPIVIFAEVVREYSPRHPHAQIPSSSFCFCFCF